MAKPAKFILTEPLPCEVRTPVGDYRLRIEVESVSGSHRLMAVDIVAEKRREGRAWLMAFCPTEPRLKELAYGTGMEFYPGACFTIMRTLRRDRRAVLMSSV